MPSHTNICLFDIPGMENLAKVCGLLQVRLLAHGGIVRRLAQFFGANGTSPKLPTLLALTPFASDIDLIHDGADELTPQVIAAIHDLVPNAECFRWEVRSSHAQAPFDVALRASGIVPVNLMRLSTVPGSGLWDPWKAWKDIKSRKYRYLRNGFYADSPLYRAGRDLECFSVLLYFLALLEANVTDFAGQPGIPDAQEVLRDAQTSDTRLAVQKSSYLRARLRYLLDAVVVTATNEPQLTTLFKDTGLDRFLTFVGGAHHRLGQHLAQLQEHPSDAIFCSAWLGGDEFRLSDVTQGWFEGDQADKECRLALRRTEVELGEPQKVLLASPRLPITPGAAPSSRVSGLIPPLPESRREAVREFVHFKVPLQYGEWVRLKRYEDAELAAVIAIHAVGEAPTDSKEEPLATTLLPVPSVCSLRWWGDDMDPAGYLSLRCNVLGLLENAPAICRSLTSQASRPALQVFVLGLGEK